MNDINRLKNYISYGIKLNISNNFYVLELQFNSDWIVYESANTNIKVYKGEKENVYYFTTGLENDINILFDQIDEVIQFNNELKIKQILYNKKIEELKRIFLKTKYEKLKNLEFTFKKKRKEVKKEQITDEKNTDKEDVTEEPKENIDEKINMAIIEHNKNNKIN